MRSGGTIGRTLRLLGRACISLILIGLVELPAADSAPEYGVKAAFLLNFLRFVEWPAAAFSSSDAPIEICIIGRDPFGQYLTDTVRGEAVQDRPILVRRVSQISSARTCQVAFVSQDTNPSRVRSMQPMGVLIVADAPRYLRDGAMIAFVLEAKRVRFDVNQKAAEGAGLKISSKLLSLARTVMQ